MSEEAEILAAELDRVRAELKTKPGPLTRLWRRVVGRLVYGGPETCGHCKRWTAPKRLRKQGWRNGDYVWYDVEGDCRLLFGKEDTTQHDTCRRFKARRRYMHRERT
jgi:hypothetical protein